MSDDQAAWLDLLQHVSAATGLYQKTPLVQVEVWTPQLWLDGTIERTLR